jgi:hypothetical protein
LLPRNPQAVHVLLIPFFAWAAALVVAPILPYPVEGEPKFYGLFSSKRAAEELTGKIAGARTQQVQLIERDQLNPSSMSRR